MKHSAEEEVWNVHKGGVRLKTHKVTMKSRCKFKVNTDSGFLRCDEVPLGGCLPTFWRIMVQETSRTSHPMMQCQILESLNAQQHLSTELHISQWQYALKKQDHYTACFCMGSLFFFSPLKQVSVPTEKRWSPQHGTTFLPPSTKKNCLWNIFHYQNSHTVRKPNSGARLLSADPITNIYTIQSCKTKCKHFTLLRPQKWNQVLLEC